MTKCCGNCARYIDGVFRQECKGVKKGFRNYPNIPYFYMEHCPCFVDKATLWGKIIKLFS